MHSFDSVRLRWLSMSSNLCKYLSYVISSGGRIGAKGSLSSTLLAFITIIPNFIESTFNITSLNGLSTTSVLILGGVVLDLKREISNIYFSEIYTDMYR